MQVAPFAKPSRKENNEKASFMFPMVHLLNILTELPKSVKQE